MTIGIVALLTTFGENIPKITSVYYLWLELFEY